MTTALELAYFLEGGSDQFNSEAAAELRRLHDVEQLLIIEESLLRQANAINAELVAALDRLIGEAEFPTQKINKLGAIIQAEMALKKAKQ